MSYFSSACVRPYGGQGTWYFHSKRSLNASRKSLTSARTIAVTRRELGVGDLRREAARRMLALALALEGSSREEAARHAGMDRPTLRDWMHRYSPRRPRRRWYWACR